MKTVEVRPGLWVVVREDWPVHYRLISMPVEKPTLCGRSKGDWTPDRSRVTCESCVHLLLSEGER